MTEHGESSSPTDNSATWTTTFSTTFDTSHSQPSNGHNPLDVTRDELEKRELSHTVQLLRLEVSQKQLMIDALKTEQASEVEEMKEKLADCQHEKKLLNLRLQSLSHAYEKEMEEVRKRKRDAPVQPLVGDFRHEVEQAFDDVGITSDEYEVLKGQDTSHLSLSQLVQIRCYELTHPLHSQCNELQLSLAELRQKLTAKDRELTQCQQKLSTVREEKVEVESRCCSMCEELADVRSKVKEGNYKITNFDTVKKERDSLCSELEKMKRLLSEQEVRESLVKEDLHKSTKQCSSAEQSVCLLKQDKEYLTRQVSALSERVATADQKIDYLNSQLSEAKQAKEELYQQLLSDKEKCRKDFDLRLQNELDDLKSRTSLQIDQLKLQTKEFYERENHSLCEAKDAAIADRERAVTSEKEVRSLYEQLLKNYHSLQASSERMSCELEAQLKIANFEKERVSLANQETLSQLRHCQLDREKLGKKLDLVSRELCSKQHEGEAAVRRMEDQLEQMRLRLEGYEKIEKELDDIVLQSAQMDHECEAERVLFSYGFGTSIPTNSRRRLQQSVQLARRVLQLEKLNSSLRQELSEEQSRSGELKQQLSSVENILSASGQPQSLMVKVIRDKEQTMKALRAKMKMLEEELAGSRVERAKLVEVKNQMSADLEKLLSHREELHYMKKALVGVAREELRPLNSDTEPAMHIPPPTLFTKRDKRKGQNNKSPSSDR